MHDDNPVSPPPPPVAQPLAQPIALPPPSPFAPLPPFETVPSPEVAASLKRGLALWLLMLLTFGAGGAVLGQTDLALLAALAGVVIAARAADVVPRWELPYTLVSLAFIGLCATSFVAIAWWFRGSGLDPGVRHGLEAACIVFAIALASTGIPAVSYPLTRGLFHVTVTTHTLRLAARVALFVFLFAVPGWFATRELLADVEDGGALFGRLASGGAVIGYVLLALAGAGFMIVRGPRATIERLGLARPTPRDLALVGIGVAALFALNSGGEWLQSRFFPGSWAADRRVNELIAHSLDRRGMLVVGVSAGIGEELTMRGALQPRLGLVLTSLLFASLHAQYSVFGIAVVFAFGLLLGSIRRASSTTVAIGVHAIYDVIALFTT